VSQTELVLGLVVVVALAGCGGLLSDAPTETTTSERPTSTDNGTTAPGIDSPTAAPNTTALYETYTSKLGAAGPGTLVWNQTTRDDQYRTHENLSLQFDRSGYRGHMIDRKTFNSGATPTTETYTTGNTTYQRTVTPTDDGDSVSFARGEEDGRAGLEPATLSNAPPTVVLKFNLRAAAWRPAGTTTYRNTPVKRYTATTTANQTALNYSLAGVDDPDLSTATLYVDENGLIRWLSIQFTGTFSDRRLQFRLHTAIVDLNDTTVSEPVWLDTARERTN